MEQGGFSFLTVVRNLAGEASDISVLVYAFAYTVGIFCVVMSFIMAAKSANPAARVDHNKMAWFWSLMVGVLLLSLPTTIASVASTMFGEGTTTDLTFGYTQSPSAPPLAPLVPILKLIGVIAVIRGLFVLRTVGMYGNYSKGNATFPRGITLIGAGVLAVHMKNFLSVFTNVTGLNLGAGLF